nr:PREDICTED: COMM domain-containing protein 2-like [Bemisia tabaci]
MIFNFKEENIQFLFVLSAPATEDFSKLIVNHLSRGGNQKLITTAAQKLGISKETIQAGIEEVIYLYVESCKRKLSWTDFKDFLVRTGFNQEQAEILSRVYEGQKCFISETLQEQQKSQFPHFSNLEWRLESQVASRSLLHQNDPTLLLELETSEGGTPRRHFLQMEPSVLQSITSKLNDALKEANSVLAKRVLKKFS